MTQIPTNRIPFCVTQMWADRSDVVRGWDLSDLPPQIGDLVVDRSYPGFQRSGWVEELSIVAEVRDGHSVLDPRRLVLAPRLESFTGMSIMLPVPALKVVILRAAGCESIEVTIRPGCPTSAGRILGSTPTCVLLLLDFGDRFLVTRNGISPDACFRVPHSDGNFYAGGSIPDRSWYAWTGLGIEAWDGERLLWFEEEEDD